MISFTFRNGPSDSNVRHILVLNDDWRHIFDGRFGWLLSGFPLWPHDNIGDEVSSGKFDGAECALNCGGHKTKQKVNERHVTRTGAACRQMFD